MKDYKSRFTMLMIFAVYCLVLMLMVTFSTAYINMASADTYKWVDEQGNTHYTQTPPPGGLDYSTIVPPPEINPDQARERLDRQKQFVDQNLRNRTSAREEQQLIKEDRLAREQNCKLGHDRLASYERPGVMLLQADGSRVRATEEQRQEQIEISQQMIEEFCPR